MSPRSLLPSSISTDEPNLTYSWIEHDTVTDIFDNRVQNEMDYETWALWDRMWISADIYCLGLQQVQIKPLMKIGITQMIANQRAPSVVSEITNRWQTDGQKQGENRDISHRDITARQWNTILPVNRQRLVPITLRTNDELWLLFCRHTA